MDIISSKKVAPLDQLRGSEGRRRHTAHNKLVAIFLISVCAIIFFDTEFLLDYIAVRELHSLKAVCDPVESSLDDTNQETIITHVFQNRRKGIRNDSLQAVVRADQFTNKVEFHFMDIEQQQQFLESHGDECYSNKEALLERYSQLSAIYRSELWKFCALAVFGGAYFDSDSPLMFEEFSFKGNIAVLGSVHPKTIYGSMIILENPKSAVALGMVRFMVEQEDLEKGHLLISKQLYKSIVIDLGFSEGSDNKSLSPGFNPGQNKSNWKMLKQRCIFDMKEEIGQKSGIGITQKCDESGIIYCCTVFEPCNLATVQLAKHPILPMQEDLPESFPRSLNYDINSDKDDAPFIASIRVEEFSRPSDFGDTPNFYNMLVSKGKVPALLCQNCLRGMNSCKACASQCTEFCSALCQDGWKPRDKFVSKKLIVTPPRYARDPSRIIPRIVHQTWFEPVSKEKYPNQSRFINSWKLSGWDYKFWDDDGSRLFLKKHFPSEVLDAYDTVVPKAFKADLFRYCVLFIYGGVYADMDILSVTKLDTIPSDIGFMVPRDGVGGANHGYCLWNGLMGSAPGHPFLAKVIENTVNQIRNRWTVLDLDQDFCPNTLFFLNSNAVLHITGPCALGYSVNELLGRHKQTNFLTGDLSADDELSIPGRSVILQADKRDMGAHRFTMVKENRLIGVTDVPGADDRQKMGKKQNYEVASGLRFNAIYGLDTLYSDRHIANEKIEVVISSDSGTE